MQDSVLAIETAKGLVGVESPAFTKDFQVWTNYLNGLEKPLNVVIFSNHPSAGLNAGEAWYGNTQTYASKNVQQAMQAGATKAIVDGLIPVYGKDFDASWAKITQTLPLGKSNIASVTVDVQEDGAGNIIYFPELKAAYIHMLGADTHSILAGAQHCDQFIAQLQQMKKSGVELIFSSHHAPEGASALDTKIAYVQAVKNIAQNSADKQSFIVAVKAKYPKLAGEQYLEMTANAFYATK